MHRIAIVGRPNVGKSSLFNRLIGRRFAIVHDQPGVTRDRLAAVCHQGKQPFELIDTGGIGDAPDPEFAEATRVAAMAAIASADLLLFIVDGRAGVTPLDRELAEQLRRSSKPLFLVINKIDEEMHESLITDFYGLGFKAMFTMSAAHGRGMSDLMLAIDKTLGEAEEKKNQVEVTVPKLAIVGRPNVGKSSLLNKLLGEERTIVSDISGTTRDAIDVACNFNGTPYILVDTAGLRHRSRPDTSVEVFSAMRSQEALRRADVGVLVLDATAGVTAQDKRIAGMLQESMKPCIIVLNKWDLMHKEDGGRVAQGEEADRIRTELFFLDFAPVVCLSAKTGQQVKRLLTALEEVRVAAEVRIGTGELNRFFKDVWENQPPPSRGGRRFKLLYATQVVPEIKKPFYPPEFLLFVNDAKLMIDSYEKYLLNTLRATWPFTGLPVRLLLKGRLSREEQDRKVKVGEKDSAMKKEMPVLKKNAKGNRLGG